MVSNYVNFVKYKMIWNNSKKAKYTRLYLWYIFTFLMVARLLKRRSEDDVTTNNFRIGFANWIDLDWIVTRVKFESANVDRWQMLYTRCFCDNMTVSKQFPNSFTTDWQLSDNNFVRYKLNWPMGSLARSIKYVIDSCTVRFLL